METAAVDPAAKPRDQLGVFFIALGVVMACGAVFTATRPREVWLEHGVWWWTGWVLGFLFPGYCFALIPWAMRSCWGVPPGSAVGDATRGFWVLCVATLSLALVDAGVVLGVRALGLQGATGMAAGYALAPAIVVGRAAFGSKKRGPALAALLPCAILWNAALVEFVGGAARVALVR